MKLLNQVGHIGISIWHITRLQGQHFHIRLFAKGFFNSGYVVHEFDGATVTDVVNAPWCAAATWGGAGALPVRVGRRGPIQHAEDTFENIVDIGEVPPVLAVVEHGNFFTRNDGFGELKQRHVWPAPGTINGKEAQPCGRQVVKMAVGMSHQFVAFLASGIEA